MPIIKYIFLLFSFLFTVNLFAQKQADTIYTVEAMTNDFIYLHQHLQINHPGFYKFTSKENWEIIYENTLNKINVPLQSVKYRLLIREYLAHVKCGHTQVIPSNKSIKIFNKRKHFAAPFKVAFLNNKIIVTSNESNDSNLVKGTEILSINGNKAAEIIDKIYLIQNADAGLQSMKNFYGASQFQTYYMAMYGEDSIYNLSCINTKGDTQNYIVKEKRELKNKVKTPKIKYTLLNQKLANFNLFNGDTQTAVFKIKGFQLKNAAKLYRKVFDQIADKQIKYLILDLRGNGGGSIMEAAELISYLSKDTFSYGFARGTQGLTYSSPFSQKVMYYVSRILLDIFGNKKEYNKQYNYTFDYDKKALKKENHFEGAVFCIIDNGSFSAASFVAAYAKHKIKAVLVGQETAGTESGCYAVNTPLMELPNTKNFIRIPHYQFKHILPLIDSNRGVIPNIETVINSQTIISENDEEMDLIWKLILENQK
ncbi:MAG: S41 family peptidase [Bacteroidia bacterium]